MSKPFVLWWTELPRGPVAPMLIGASRWRVLWVPRGSNVLAHKLARRALREFARPRVFAQPRILDERTAVEA